MSHPNGPGVGTLPQRPTPPAQEASSAHPAAPIRRYSGLDGLRGTAALVVLVCHTFLVVPGLAFAYFTPERIVRGSLAWWATFSPLHVLWAGTEAVYLFFVLSGFVLTLPFLGKPRWAGYYPKRLLRLYLPTWGSMMLVLLWMAVLPRNFAPGDSLWLQAHPPVLPPESIASQFFLLPPGPMSGNSVLWTLRFEVLFSLLLPLVFYFAVKLPRLNLIKVIVLFGVMGYFAFAPFTLRFLLPMFGLGSIMAVERHRMVSVAKAIRSLRAGRLVWVGLSAVSLLLLGNAWTVAGLTSNPDILAVTQRWAGTLTVAGACIALFLAAEGSWRRPLEKPAVRWLGSRSFSLYLVHEPIVVSVAVLLGGNPGLVPALAVVVPVSLLAAELFYRVIEHPSQLLARAVGRRVDRSLAG